MPIVVQKFGGTSVADTKKILSAARKAVHAFQQGNQVVMVVSAMGKNTDMLEALAREINERPPAREMDMLLSTGEQVSVALMAMAINALGHKAISLTGAQIGIKTDSSHTKARIRSISTDRMRGLLDDGNIVIAAGFQGIDDNFNITTLGRGGSDTTAVALAAVLGADLCEIYTDVDGVFTTDPRILPEAVMVKQVCYDEMLELASLGAGVMHSRSIEFGKKFGVPIHVRSSLNDRPGSLIIDQAATENMPVSGAALTKDEARISLFGVPDIPGTIRRIFAPISAQKITVDMIVQNLSENQTADISFTVPRQELQETLQIVETIARELGASGILSDENVSKVSVVGLGMAERSGVANRMFRALAAANLNMQMITTSEIKISALVHRDQALHALRTVHREFELEKIAERIDDQLKSIPGQQRQANAIEVVQRLQQQGMEGLTIDDVSLDEQQSRITLNGIPNNPGVAAQLFDEVANRGIFVDMIVQSYTSEEIVDISFTVPRSQFGLATAVALEICETFGCRRVDFKEKIAKLSVSGIGLRSHTSVAIGMFEALSKADINIETINTSEVRVNVVVDGSQGAAAQTALREQFKEELGM